MVPQEKYSIADNTVNRYGNSKNNPAAELMEKRERERQEQQYQSQKTKQDMEKLRTKANNDGFYN